MNSTDKWARNSLTPDKGEPMHCEKKKEERRKKEDESRNKSRPNMRQALETTNK